MTMIALKAWTILQAGPIRTTGVFAINDLLHKQTNKSESPECNIQQLAMWNSDTFNSPHKWNQQQPSSMHKLAILNSQNSQILFMQSFSLTTDLI